MPIELNDLETRRFGIACAKRTDPDAPLSEVNAAARAQGVRMLSTRVDVADLSQVHALEADGYLLMDTLVYYRRSLGPEWQEPTPAHDYQMRLATASDAPAITEIARHAFRGYIGHYHTDPRLENADADAAYVEWADNSIRHMHGGDTAVVVVDGEEIAGFVTLRRNTDAQYELVLSGVNPNFQRGGIYASLLARGCSVAQERGGTEAITSTQVNNYAVQKVWGRLGMGPYRGYYTFHKWFD